MLKKEQLKNIDGWLILCMLALTVISNLAISSATAYSGDTTNLKKQIIFFVIGLVLMLIVMSVDYHTLGDWYLFIYIGTVILLLAVFFIGSSKNNAARWIDFGFIQIQPSEFAKIAMILCCAKLIDKYNNKINRISSLLIILAFEFVPFILVNRQPNLSTSIVFLVILVIQLFASKLDMKIIITCALAGILLVGSALIYIITNPNQILIKEYQRERIMNSLHKDEEENNGDRYQTNQSIHAIGSGGLKGKGLYQGSISQLNYLPESHNDFIGAVIAEEFGFIGMSIVIGIFLLFIGRGLWIARAAPDEFGRLIIVGYMGMIAMQAFVNLGVVTDVLPNTGLPLPFISYGGSALWTNMIGLGLVLNVGMRKENTMF